MVRVIAVLASLIALLAAALPAMAETRYISDVLVVSIRETAEENSKALKLLRSGTTLELIEESDQFARVRTSDGTEGWVSKRYLTQTLPKEARIAALEKELASLKAGGASHLSSPDTSSEELARLKEALKASRAEIETLKAQSGSSAGIVAERDALKVENEVLKHQASLFGQTLTFFKNKDVLIWFFSGAGVLLMGWLIGRSARGRRY